MTFGLKNVVILTCHVYWIKYKSKKRREEGRDPVTLWAMSTTSLGGSWWGSTEPRSLASVRMTDLHTFLVFFPGLHYISFENKKDIGGRCFRQPRYIFCSGLAMTATWTHCSLPLWWLHIPHKHSTHLRRHQDLWLGPDQLPGHTQMAQLLEFGAPLVLWG